MLGRMKNNLNVINFFSGPGSGKSTVASGLFHRMKMKGYSVELVTEYAKDLVWEGRNKTLTDQFYITATQNHRIEMLVGEVEYVITDSPILLGLLYAPANYYHGFFPFVWEVFNSYTNVNILLNRVKPYVVEGRNQTEFEAIKISEELEDLLIQNNVKYLKYDADETVISKIMMEIQRLDESQRMKRDAYCRR